MAHGYSDYIAALKNITSATSCDGIPRLTVIHGSSEFLRMRAMAAIKSTWSKLDPNDLQNLEGSTIDHPGFRSLWSQISLFEPESVYVMRRCDKLTKLGAWLKEIKTASAIKNHLILEFGEKIPAEIMRQVTRLSAVMLPCEEPTTPLECGKIVATLAKREGLILQDDAVKLLLDSAGLDLGKLDNEIRKLSLIYHGRKEPVTALEVAPIAGHLREDHVFELFGLLRNRQRARAQLLVDQLLDRGEKAIALVGILARFAREAATRHPQRGLLGLRLCADADIRLKSSRIPEALVLGRIIDALVD